MILLDRCQTLNKYNVMNFLFGCTSNDWYNNKVTTTNPDCFSQGFEEYIFFIHDI